MSLDLPRSDATGRRCRTRHRSRAHGRRHHGRAGRAAGPGRPHHPRSAWRAGAPSRTRPHRPAPALRGGAHPGPGGEGARRGPEGPLSEEGSGLLKQLRADLSQAGIGREDVEELLAPSTGSAALTEERAQSASPSETSGSVPPPRMVRPSGERRSVMAAIPGPRSARRLSRSRAASPPTPTVVSPATRRRAWTSTSPPAPTATRSSPSTLQFLIADPKPVRLLGEARLQDRRGLRHRGRLVGALSLRCRSCSPRIAMAPADNVGPLVAQLAQAMGDRRFVEPRLTGGFQHGRLVTLRSGDTPHGPRCPARRRPRAPWPASARGPRATRRQRPWVPRASPTSSRET